ncbi:hypothetical protein PV327_000826 [Microctonus hyperodae]|nr:hypothetical protein PV327_000826 [Microctonus hyperodae]
MSDNIKVAIKVRPLIKREQDEKLPIQWIVEENAMVRIDPETKKRGDTKFQFDYIFDMGQTNQDVFDTTVKPIVEGAMNGFNGTIFTYGQTGSGKTYTMMGTKEESGVIPLAVNYIFNYIRNDCRREFLLRVSYIEIYNERINDLLDTKKADLKIKEDCHGHIIIDCKEEVANSPECILRAMKKGDKNRRIGETNMNERSSRSHTIFRISIESCEKSDPDATTQEAQLNLIDLAGSERASQTRATGERFNEGRHINLSLSTLAFVIKQLSESQTFINYRDSKLTRMLQQSLGGNALTAVICAVTPAADDETQHTLAFAVRAKGIKNKPQVNENVSDKALLKRIYTQKAKLEAEMQDMKTEFAEKTKQMLRDRIILMNMQILTNNSRNEEEFGSKARRRRTWAGTSTIGTKSSSPPLFLPTIDECEHKQIHEEDESNHDHNIYEIDVHDQSFQTAFADFELQLIEDQREKNRFSDYSDSGYVPSSITVRPQITVEDVDEENRNICSPERTPERKRDSLSRTPSPCTPKTELREKIINLRSEFNTLREFTTLEKQLLQSDCIAVANQTQYEKNLAFVTKSLSDSEQMCKDLNKKYAELQSDHAILLEKYEESTHNCEVLRKEVESLSSLRETLTLLESERNDLESKMNTALLKQKSLEDETASREFEMNLLKTKHKSREKELEGSLNLAWKEFIDPAEKQKLTDVIHLQSVIAELTAKISLLESQQSNINTESTSFTENGFILKIDELDQSLKQSQAENSILIEKLSYVNDCMEQCNKTSSVNEFDIQIQEYIKKIEELEKIIAQKDSEIFNNNNHNLISQFEDANDKLKISESRIDEMKNDIEQLQSDLYKKSSELQEIKLRLDATLMESEETSRVTQSQFLTNKEQLEAAISAIEIKDLEIAKMKEILATNENKLQTDQELSEVNKNDNVVAESIEDHNAELEKRNAEIIKLKELIDDSKVSFTSTIKSYEDKINELTATNEKLRDQIALIISEKTVYDGDRIAMQKLIQEKDNELQLMPQLKSQLEFAMSEKIEFERMISDLRTQINEKILEIEKMHNYESEISNLNSYVVSSETFVKKLQKENEEMKKELEKMTNTLKILENERLQLIETESLKVVNLSIDSSLQNISRRENIAQNTILNDSNKSTPRICQIVKPLNISEAIMSAQKIQPMKNFPNTVNDDKESSSIFANESYFNNMDVSVTPCELTDTVAQSVSINDSLINNTTVMESKLEDSVMLLNLTCDNLDDCLSEKCSQELVNIVKELFSLKTTLEEENVKLAMNLQSKIRETTEIQNDFGAFKLDFEKLQQTILALTTENSDIAGRFEIEKKRVNEIQINSQKQIDELEAQLAALKDEKHAHEANIKLLEEKVVNYESSTSTINDEKIKEIIDIYEEKIQALTDENIQLSSNLMEKIEELENIRGKVTQPCKENCEHYEKLQHMIERVSILENENVDLSEHLMAKIDELDNINDKYESLKQNADTKLNDHDESLEKTIVHLSEKIKILNAQLQDSKLMSCQCTNQSELNETRCAIKNDMELLNSRLQKFQENVERVRTEAEKRTNMIDESNNISLHEISFNNTFHESLNNTIIDEKVCQLKTNYASLYDNLQKWSLTCEKISDCDKSRDNNTSDIHDTSCQSVSESPRISKRGTKIDRRQSELEQYKIERQTLENSISAFEKFENEMVHLQHEIKNLRKTVEVYKKKMNSAEKTAQNAQENARVLDEKIITLNEQLEHAQDDIKKLSELKLALEEEIENIKTEKNNIEKVSNELRQSLMETKDSNVSLQTELEKLMIINKNNDSFNDQLEEYKSKITTLENEIQQFTISLKNSEEINNDLKCELEVIKSTPPSEREQLSKLTSILEQYREKVEILETSVKELREKLSFYEKENANLSDQIAKLQTSENKINLNVSDNNMEICDESFTQNSSKDNEIVELTNARVRITKEITTLQRTESKNYNEKSVSELFDIFLTALMAKEQEIIKTVTRRHEREKHELVEQNKQCADAEKRSTAWAKELESDIERLQNDLSKQEIKNAALASQISKLENLLLDSDHEKQLMKEKMVVMETDFNALQSDYEKNIKSNVQSNDTMSISSGREKWIQEATEKCGIEYKNKLAKVECEFKAKLAEISNALETTKTKNMDLKRELEALEANERHLKSIIDLKTNEFVKANSTIERLQKELKDLTEIYNQINSDNQIKCQKIEEITGILKQKCDKVSEYKTNLETIKPEYDILKMQASERQLRLEMYKTELEKLRDESKQQISSMKDQLDLEQIKSAGLNKQLTDIINRNTVVQSELEQSRDKCHELERENERLLKKVRNSTSKLTAEREMEDLRDENRMHLKSLEGASNRIAELQNQKSQLMKDHVELQGRYKIIHQENIELKNVLDKIKTGDNDVFELREKYDELVCEKNKIALELEEKRLLIIQFETKIERLTKDNDKLKNKNEELDAEMDDIVKKIHEMDEENTELQRKIYELEDKDKSNANNDNFLTINDTDFKILKQLNAELTKELEAVKMTTELLRKENAELRRKLGNRDDGKSCGSLRSTSPTPLNRSRQRRSVLFNQNRSLESAEDVGVFSSYTACQCEQLRKKITELEQEMVTRKAKLATLEMQIESEMFPYKRQCEQMEETLLAYKQHNMRLLTENKELLTKKTDCEKCKHQRLLHEQGTQMSPQKQRIYLSGSSKSGIVEDYAKELWREKLEKDKKILKRELRRRYDEVCVLKEKVKELESQSEMWQSGSGILDKNKK